MFKSLVCKVSRALQLAVLSPPAQHTGKPDKPEQITLLRITEQHVYTPAAETCTKSLRFKKELGKGLRRGFSGVIISVQATFHAPLGLTCSRNLQGSPLSDHPARLHIYLGRIPHSIHSPTSAGLTAVNILSQGSISWPISSGYLEH